MLKSCREWKWPWEENLDPKELIKQFLLKATFPLTLTEFYISSDIPTYLAPVHRHHQKTSHYIPRIPQPSCCQSWWRRSQQDEEALSRSQLEMTTLLKQWKRTCTRYCELPAVRYGWVATGHAMLQCCIIPHDLIPLSSCIIMQRYHMQFSGNFL